MIDYETLCQNISDCRAGNKPALPPPLPGGVAAAPEYAEAYEEEQPVYEEQPAYADGEGYEQAQPVYEEYEELQPDAELEISEEESAATQSEHPASGYEELDTTLEESGGADEFAESPVDRTAAYVPEDYDPANVAAHIAAQTEEQTPDLEPLGEELAMEDVTAMDADTMTQIPMDGTAQGEIMIRGNSVMKGYLKNPKATAEAFRGGYFHSGDIAVQHPDGYLQIADRAKDIIISGGENISSVEVEGVLMRHPAVLLCAVVAKPDDKWGETPCAFVDLKDGAEASESEQIAFARERLAGFKTPKTVVFQDLPKTSTGKIQKFELRQIARAL